MWRGLLILFLFLACGVQRCMGTGKGPVGIWAVDSRFAVIADSNFNGILLVDVVVGGLVAALTFRPQHWASLTGVGSCFHCRRMFVSSTHNPRFFFVEFSRTFADMVASQDFQPFENGTIVDLPFGGFGSTRMIQVMNDGRRGFVADYGKGVCIIPSTKVSQLS